MTTPQGRVAQQFMEHKGLGELKPYDMEKLDSTPCWYFYYELPEGTLELEVYWSERKGWEPLVTAFPLVS